MIFNAVIVKSKMRKIRQISRTGYFYATEAVDGCISNRIKFYKNEEIARNNYPKEIEGILHVLIDTDKMEFFGRNNVAVLSKPDFTETDAEYIFSFAEGIEDLHCKIQLTDE